MKTFVSVILIVLLGVCSFVGAGTGTPSGSASNSTATGSTSVPTDADGDFNNFEIEVEPDRVGNTAAYSLDFIIENVRYLELKIGLLSFDFPEHTDLTNVTVTSFEDDSEWADFHVVTTTIDGTRLTLEVKKRPTKPGQDKKCDSVAFELELAGIVNSTIAGTHRLAAIAAQGNGKILAGPTLSEPFELTSGHITVDRGSFLPDSIYPGVHFDISFSLLSEDVTGPFDSTFMNIDLRDSSGSGYDAHIFFGKITPTSFLNGRINYSGLKGSLTSAGELTSGFYEVHLSFQLLANGQYYSLPDPVIDSIFVHEPTQTQLSYQDNSLEPKVISVNEPTVVSFTIDLDSDQTLDVDAVQSTVTLRGDAFTTTVSIDPRTVQLTPGSNVIKSQPIYIPPSQLGQELTAEINISYMLQHNGQAILFNSDANGETIFVQDKPVLRVNSLVTEAFNGNYVNTGQSFKILAEVENLSTETVRNISTILSSDGLSQFIPLVTLDSILPSSVTQVTWEIIASAQPTYAEVFTVRIDNDNIGQLPPLDNITLAIIESPAELVLTHELHGVIGDMVEQQGHFVLTTEMYNVGDSEVEPGEFLLTTGGVNFGLGDSIRSEIIVREHINYEFTAPPFDTAVEFVFTMTQIPIDRNTGLHAQMDSTSFTFDIRVQSLSSYLVADAELLGTNLVSPGNAKRMYRLTLTNQSDVLTDKVELKEITMGLHLDDNTRPGTEEIINSHLSTFTRDGLELPVSFTGGDVLTAHFENVTIPAGVAVVLEFVPMISQQLDQSFSLTLEAGDIVLEKTDGPQAGQRVPVATPGGNRFLISQTYISRGDDLLESFIIERNPFNPDEGEVTFGYRLDRPSTVNFRVYTLIGEEVYTTSIGLNDAGSRIGEHDVAWDGRNNDGNMVHSGVYIAILEVVATGEKARLKVAVMR